MLRNQSWNQRYTIYGYGPCPDTVPPWAGYTPPSFMISFWRSETPQKFYFFRSDFVMSAVINRTDQQTKVSFLSSAVIIHLLL